MKTYRETQASSSSLEIERNGYNVAFSELGLEWYWDAKTYAELHNIPEEKNRVRTYIETHQPHLMRAYDADFLATAIHAARARFDKAMTY